jgi:Leucine-rich repeat (LRR) protein
LSNSTFLGLNWVEKIWLQKNELKELGLVFGNLFNLQNIVLDHNNLEKIDSEIFKHNKNLKTIELCSNDFSKINSLIINNLTNLISISLHNNSNLKEISVLESSWVEILTLDNNKLTEIGRNLKLANLKSLYLINNLILKLKNSSFAYLKELLYLNLQSNRIITIEKTSFKGLSKLKTLILKNNYLDGSYSDYFIEDLTNMETLDLSYNQYQYFGKDFFRNLKKLNELKINNNLLKQIDSDLFQHNSELKSLCLNANKLKNITLNSSKLIQLDINSNFITEIKDEYLKLPNSEKIDCASNLIESIHFNKTFRLGSIDLSNNKFTVLNSSFFSHYKYINLTILKMNGTYTFGAEISDLENLVEIDLSFNTILSSNFTLKYHKNLQKVKFRQMKNFTNFNLLINPNLKEVDFSQNSLINQFSIFDILEKIEILELSQVGLAEIVELKLELFHDLSKLDLSYNLLTYLNESTFTRMSKLTYLDLSFNRIKHLDVNIFKWLRTLIYLDMKNNQISFICDEFLNYLDIANLKLAHNQLKKLPKFKINIETDRPISLSELSLENNLFSHIEQFPMGIGQLKSLKLDSNNISSIEHDAFFFLSNLKKLSISNNSIRKIYGNIFYGMISTNKIAYIEENTFQNLNKLLVLDLSQNYIKSIDANVFYGLTSLRDLFLKEMFFEINDQSFNYLNNLSNIHMTESIIKENECLVIRLFKREMVKKSFLHENEYILTNRSVFRLYYRSINILTNESLIKRECDIGLFFLQFIVHLDLKTDNQMENFYFQCGKNLINQKNYYSANKLKCFIPTFNKSSQDSISFFIKINLFILNFCISVLRVYF